jgi:HK97 gp10 family phage protein
MANVFSPTRDGLQGVADLTRKLQALGKLDDGKALRRCVLAGIKPAKALAIAYIPVGTEPHRLRNGLLVAPGFAKTQIKTKTTINAQKNIASAVLGVTGDAYYAVQFVEMGTRKQRAQPWLRRALTDGRSDGEAALRASLQKDVLKAAAS